MLIASCNSEYATETFGILAFSKNRPVFFTIVAMDCPGMLSLSGNEKEAEPVRLDNTSKINPLQMYKAASSYDVASWFISRKLSPSSKERDAERPSISPVSRRWTSSSIITRGLVGRVLIFALRNLLRKTSKDMSLQHRAASWLHHERQ